MSEVAITLGAFELAMKLAELLRQREEARTQLALAANTQAAQEARARMDAAHAAALAVHTQLQAALAEPPVVIPITVGAGQQITITVGGPR